ncbi:Glucosamine-6-phosphate deaminase 1 [Aquisphaera giovannonii]|uniref:Glucosamine-6-phosphate deaminase 1 n=1 Tax=Aquisphaera giovannonii TaxID=406548 RepID=A0A5B9WAV9_9BACT|nr:glucosamine-6-phosphate deaminase [Aquisphaera giovannonii]QEH37607.1 Glucosamine-6-phosphate deaminase 1 [Aquisphaera giovannonii]
MPEESRSFQRAGMTVRVFPDAGAASRAAADRIASTIRAASPGHRAILGMATGATPQKVYSHLASLHAAGGLSFRDAVTYNLDEYYPIQPLDPKSYRCYMHRHFFSLVDLPPQQGHVLDGTVPEGFVAAHCAEFERWIEADGGLDLQLLGIGRNGHIGFNEPSELTVAEALALPTRLIELHPLTREDAAREFGGVDKVIPRALTLGVRAILSARSILMLATGAHKAEAVAAALAGQMRASLPASLLQAAGERVTWLVDEAAASGVS